VQAAAGAVPRRVAAASGYAAGGLSVDLTGKVQVFQPDIVLCAAAQRRNLLIRQWPRQAGRIAFPRGPGRHDRAGYHHRAGGNHAFVFQHCPIHYDGAHAHQAAMANRTGMQNNSVPHGNVISQDESTALR